MSVLSGNRNFEGRINPDVKMNYLASPPLVVAYALAGSMDADIVNDPIGQDPDGNDVYLRDLWPSTQEVGETVEAAVRSTMFRSAYAGVFKGDERWNSLEVPTGNRFAWDEKLDLRPPAAVLRRHAGRARAGVGHLRARGCSPCSATR